MVISPDRLIAANWVFQSSMVSFVLGILGITYNATIIAHEKMSAFSYIAILQVVLNLFNVIFIAYAPGNFDHLICYALLTVGVSVLIQIIYMSYCRRKFEECYSLKLIWDNNIWKSIAGFSVWNFIGGLASRLKWDGVNLLLNLFFGTVVNAARGIASSVNGAVSAFAGNFMTAMTPQITKSYAAGDKEYMFSLVNKGSRFCYYILLMLILPIICETNLILTIWLKHFPEYTLNFTRLALILSLCDILSEPLIKVQLATGKVKYYQLTVGLFLMLNLPISYIFLKLGFTPEVVFVVAIFLSLISLYLRLLFMKHYTGMHISFFLINVFLKVLYVSFISAIIPVLICYFMQDSWIRLLLVLLVSGLCSCITIFYVGCSKQERGFIIEKSQNLKLLLIDHIK